MQNYPLSSEDCEVRATLKSPMPCPILFSSTEACLTPCFDIAPCSNDVATPKNRDNIEQTPREKMTRIEHKKDTRGQQKTGGLVSPFRHPVGIRRHPKPHVQPLGMFLYGAQFNKLLSTTATTTATYFLASTPPLSSPSSFSSSSIESVKA
jgi:hypothetical protein